nr:MAG TPA: hypothetical protein [Caudoviricetes sp.]
MNKVKHTANLLLVLFSPVILVVVARAMHTVCMWVLTGIVPPQEAWYFALLLTIISFTVVGCYAFCKWIDG